VREEWGIKSAGMVKRRFGVDFNFIKNSMWSKVDRVLGILEECPSLQ
jgi:hypothetical protein